MSTIELEDQLTANTRAVSESQGVMAAVLERISKGDSTVEKAAKLGQLVIPLIVIWLVYYVNAEIAPVKLQVSTNSVMIKESKDVTDKLRNKLHDYDVREARRDAIMEQMIEDLAEIKASLKKLTK